MEYSTFIRQILEKAAGIAKQYFGKVSATTKAEDNNQVLTQADIEIGQLIISQIRDTYPMHNIIGEETGVIDRQSHYTWVVDPIDGTSNFAVGLPFYGIMVGLLKDAIPIAGGMNLPYFSEIYITERGKGAFCNERKLAVTKETNLLSALVTYPIDGYQDRPEVTRNECRLLAEIILGIRNLRTTGSMYDALMVAKGSVGGFLNRTSKIWDNVAPQLIIEEAGGKYTDFWGKPMDYATPLNKSKANFTVCAAAPKLHKKLQEIIHQKTQKKI